MLFFFSSLSNVFSFPPLPVLSSCPLSHHRRVGFDFSRVLLFFFFFVLVFIFPFRSNLSSFCYVVTTVMDDAPPGTQEYIILRQDSIQSAELKKKESPFRAKCHEILCCPLKQVHLKEDTEPEGLCIKSSMFVFLLSFHFRSVSFFLAVGGWGGNVPVLLDCLVCS